MSNPLPRIVGVVLVIAAAAWLAWLLTNNLHSLPGALAQIRLGHVLLALGPALLLRIIAARVFYLFLRHTAHLRSPPPRYYRHYFLSQIVRYLPGRIWSVVYQTNAWGEHIRPFDVWKSNIWSIAMMTGNELFVTGAIVCLYVGQPTAAAALVIVGAVVVFAILRSVQIILLFELNWIIILIAWWLLTSGSALGGDFMDTLVLCAAYITGWTLGFAAFVLPDGWLVREAAFIAIGRALGYDAAQLLVLSAVARALFMSADLIAAAIAMLLPARKASNS